MSRVILFGFALISLLSVVCGRYVKVYDTDAEWTVMGVYDTPVQYATPTKGEVQYQQVEYAAPLKSTPIQYQYTAPAVKAAPLQYATVQIPETRYQTTYQNVPQTSYNIVPIVTLQKSRGDVGDDDDDDDEMPGNGGGRYGGMGYGGMGGMVAGPFVNPAMGGFGYGAKGGFGSFGGGYGAGYGAGNYPLGTYFGFPTIAFLEGVGGGGFGGGHGGH